VLAADAISMAYTLSCSVGSRQLVAWFQVYEDAMTIPFQPSDPDFASRVRASFVRQTVMTTIGAEMTQIAPGAVEIAMPYRADLAQQHGFLHAGVISMIVDSACGYAALSLMPGDTGVLTVEYKVNFIAPAAGERFVARGRVTKPGRTLTVCVGDVFAQQDGEERLIATMLTTMMAIRDRGNVRD
jgi:uncharacterized protein (TIGR00369 family)